MKSGSPPRDLNGGWASVEHSKDELSLIARVYVEAGDVYKALKLEGRPHRNERHCVPWDEYLFLGNQEGELSRWNIEVLLRCDLGFGGRLRVALCGCDEVVVAHPKGVAVAIDLLFVKRLDEFDAALLNF
ncbi:hypothetical protein ACVWW4_006010 [Bradyrhizobium sp. LB7.1]